MHLTRDTNLFMYLDTLIANTGAAFGQAERDALVAGLTSTPDPRTSRTSSVEFPNRPCFEGKWAPTVSGTFGVVAGAESTILAAPRA